MSYTPKMYFLTVLEVGSLRPGCEHDQGLVRAVFWLLEQPPSLCALIWQRERKRESTRAHEQVHKWASFLVSRFIRHWFHREGCASMTSSTPKLLPKAQSPNSITLWGRASTLEYGEYSSVCSSWGKSWYLAVGA